MKARCKKMLRAVDGRLTVPHLFDTQAKTIVILIILG